MTRPTGTTTPVPAAPPRLGRARVELGPEELDHLGEGSDLESVDLTGDALAGRDLTGSTWLDVVATDLDLTGAVLDHVSVMDVELRRCDLANVGARNSSIVRTAIAHGRAVGFAAPDGLLRDVTFTETQLDLANLRFAKLECVVFRGCRMHEADLSSAKLTSVVFDHCDLRGVDLSRTSFERCEMRGCTLDDARGLTSFAGVSMPWPDIVELAPVLAAALGLRALDDA